MAKLYETIRYWADGQNALNAAETSLRATLQATVEQALPRLQRQTSLGDLASAYYDDSHWWGRVAQEFALSPRDSDVARNAAYWQRFMQIRHPSRSPRRAALAE